MYKISVEKRYVSVYKIDSIMANSVEICSIVIKPLSVYNPSEVHVDIFTGVRVRFVPISVKSQKFHTANGSRDGALYTLFTVYNNIIIILIISSVIRNNIS